MSEAPEGSDERRRARMLLMLRAEQAQKSGSSFDGWLEHEAQHLVDAVTQGDLDAIFNLVWKKKLRGA